MATIYLIGFMGSGKSSTGKRLAKKLNYNFIDLDKLIESDYQTTIADVFKERGEREFRNIEHNTLKKIIGRPNTIIACGGGTPCFFDNIELMNNSGITIYLKLSAKTLCERLLESKNPRPLIVDKSKAELEKFVSDLLDKREDFYHKASYIVKGKTMNLKALQEFLSDKI